VTTDALRVSLLGVDVDAVTVPEVLDDIAVAVEARRRLLVANHNLHSVRLVRDDPEMRALFARAGRVVIDGMALVWVGRLLGHPLRREHRMTCVDWIPELLDRARRESWRVFVLASDPATHERGMHELRRRFPDLELAGHHGWFELGGTDDDRVVAAVRGERPDVVLVGMGMPRQERWLANRLDALGAPVVVTVGGWLDYVGDARATPPRWLARMGFEWLARLVDEPRRLGYRYLVEPWPLLPVLVRDLRVARGSARRRRAAVRSG
jgi:N-acetylglucosaminyldiphosphoundecaprenol N-acetyl-beta-D-mannosaminyltransferase